MAEKDVRVAAVMTAPRHEITWARTHIQKALQPLGIPLNVSGGVFYGQCMQTMLGNLLKEGADYALTIDFDSVFTTADVKRLVSIVVQEKEIDALCGVQAKRGKGSVLASLSSETVVEWTGYPVRVNTAHFGLTVLDLRKLEQVPKPWFLTVPDTDGDYGDGRTDEDVYFWRVWGESGNSVFIDPGCKVGHLEEMVTTFDDQMKLVHVYPQQWANEHYGN